MDHFYSDLEEGEILDDSPPSPDLNIDRRKELPQRYVVKGNKTPLHKHKRSCRHSSRHHTRKPPNMKKKPVRKKNSPKWHHKPPYTNEKHKIVSKYDSSKHALPKCFSENSLIAEMKGSLKSISPLKKLRTNFSNSKSQKIPFPKQNFKTSKNDFATSEISSAKMLQNVVENSVASNASTNSEYVIERTDSIEDLSKNSDDDVIELSICDTKPEPPLIDLSRSPEDTSSTIELIDVKIEDNAISNNSVPIKEEESEDEEELRRIALATCAKRKALRESTNTIQNVDYASNAPVPDLICVNDVPIISHQKINNPPTMDNYEVVDMEVDEDMQDSLENQQTSLIDQQPKSAENLFVIDRNPSNEYLKNKNSFSETQAATNSDDEDFEVNLLRAQLLTNMNRNKFLKEHSDQESNVIVHKKPVAKTPAVPQKVNNYQKRNLLFSHKRLKSAKHFLRRRSVNKLININSSNNNNEIKKAPPLPVVQTSKPPERLIITVNGESSDESDNSEEETNTVSENPVDSIVALISDCRQKSESSVETKEKEVVPKAVSCLSKAQQEEYNSLMKILAKKKKSSPAQEAVSTKNGSVHSPLEDLKKLEGKLVTLQKAQKTKKDSIALLSEEVNSKRHHYMKAKLTAQHLKEQWVAAEKVRKAKLLDWSKTCDNFKLMKKSVSDLENKINEVQNLCSKLGSSVHGQTYKLPLLSGNEQS